jgi:excisionase family DNA binding protein
MPKGEKQQKGSTGKQLRGAKAASKEIAKRPLGGVITSMIPVRHNQNRREATAIAEGAKKPSTSVGIDAEMLRVKEVSIILSCSQAHVYRLITEHEIPCIRIGGILRVPKRRLYQWLEDSSEASLRAR